MNRKKKLNNILKKRLKKSNEKLHTSNKPKYISKSERALLEQQNQQASTEVTEADVVANES